MLVFFYALFLLDVLSPRADLTRIEGGYYFKSYFFCFFGRGYCPQLWIFWDWEHCGKMPEFYVFQPKTASLNH